MEVQDIVQEIGIKTIPKGKKCKKQNGCLRKLRRPKAVKRREAKSKEKRKDIPI